MTPEEIARAHQFREGFTLVDYAEVGLPIFRLTIEAITTSQRLLPTIHEFVMRCLALGESREDAVARMLGLRPEVVGAAIDALVSDGHVARLAGSTDVQAFALTEGGEARLSLEAMEVPQEEMLVIDYDGIRRIPVRLAGTTVLRHSELRSAGALEIRPYPAEPPAIDALPIPDVTKVIRRQAGEDFRRTVLALKRVVRRNNVFREAVALVFAADRGDEVQVAFAVDGRLSEPHERAFAENGGPKKMGFLKSVAETDTTQRLEKVLGKQILRAYPSRFDLIAIRKSQADSEATIRTTAAAADNSARGSPARAALAAAKDDLESAMQILAGHAFRPMDCYEQGALLNEALEHAKRRLLVTSHGLQPLLLSSFLLRQIDRLLDADVEVRIETPSETSAAPKVDLRYDPRLELAKRSTRGAPVLATGPKRPLYFLIKDDEMAVICNRPFFGDAYRRTGFARVSGTVIRDEATVRALRHRWLEPASRSGA